MNIKKIISALSVLTAASAFYAQTVNFHGYLDYTNFPVGQTFSKTDDADWEHTDPAAEFGSFYNGRSEINAYVDAANFHFILGVRLDASLGSWYDSYSTADDNEGLAGGLTYFHQGNMRVDLFNGQARIWTGKFEEWNNGYIADGFVMEGQNIKSIADRGMGQHFTGLEILPYAVPGLSLMGGFPILPVDGNGINSAEYNTWEKLYKKGKILAKYQLNHGEIFAAGWRPETHYEGTEDYSDESYFGEAFFQVSSPRLFDKLDVNATYDFRYRDVEATGDKAFMHYIGVSGQYRFDDKWTLSAENRTAYSTEHYITLNEKLFYDSLGFHLTYNIPNTTFVLGFKTVGALAYDANGTLFKTEARIKGKYSDDFAMTVDWMPYAAAPEAGSKGTYYGAYAYPYFQKNFRNGYLRTGVEVQYTKFETTNSTQAVGYRIPLALCFWF